VNSLVALPLTYVLAAGTGGSASALGEQSWVTGTFGRDDFRKDDYGFTEAGSFTQRPANASWTANFGGVTVSFRALRTAAASPGQDRLASGTYTRSRDSHEAQTYTALATFQADDFNLSGDVTWAGQAGVVLKGTLARGTFAYTHSVSDADGYSETGALAATA